MAKEDKASHLEPPILKQGGGKSTVGPTSAHEVGAHKRHHVPMKGMKKMKGGKKDCY